MSSGAAGLLKQHLTSVGKACVNVATVNTRRFHTCNPLRVCVCEHFLRLWIEAETSASVHVDMKGKEGLEAQMSPSTLGLYLTCVDLPSVKTSGMKTSSITKQVINKHQ